MLHNTTEVVCNHFSQNQPVAMKSVILGRGGYMPTASLMFTNTKINELLESYKSAPIGDFFVQVYMAALGGAYYINEPMCVYRRNAIGSWTKSHKNIEKKKAYNMAMVESVDNFTNYIEEDSNKNNLHEVMLTYTKSYIELHNNPITRFIALYKLSKSHTNSFRFFAKNIHNLIPKILISFFK